MTPLPSYDPNEPPRLQQHDWDCAQESLEWCLYAWGRTPDDSWMESSLIAGGYLDPAVGCTDASGAGLVRWVEEQYAQYGFSSSNQVGVSFDQVKDEAAQRVHPLAMGGEAWYHWTAVSGYDAFGDRLKLANPAPGYQGIYGAMTRTQFSEMGPFNLVRVCHPEAEGGQSTTSWPLGPDVSSHQGAVDWAAVRASGCAFGFSKASGGVWYRNPTFQPNWHGMAQAGLQRGAYHFAFESSGQPFPGPGPEAEATYFLDTVAPLGIARGDMLVLDIEQGAGQLGEWALRWLRHVEQAMGFKPILYTGAWFSDPHGFGSVPELASYPLWQAAYQASPPSPCAPWSSFAFWQFTDRATVPGIATPADGNRFSGTLDALPGMGKPGAAPDPGDPYAPWRGAIGSGILEQMQAAGVLPVQSSSTWLPLGKSPADIEECMASDGSIFRWSLSQNQCYRFFAQ